MYIYNNQVYPNMVNDFSQSIDTRKLFDLCLKLYLNYNNLNNNNLKNNNLNNNNLNNKSKKYYYNATNYQGDDFISFIYHNQNFITDDGNVSSTKLINYFANIVLDLFYQKKSDKQPRSCSKEDYEAAIEYIKKNSLISGAKKFDNSKSTPITSYMTPSKTTTHMAQYVKPYMTSSIQRPMAQPIATSKLQYKDSNISHGRSDSNKGNKRNNSQNYRKNSKSKTAQRKRRKIVGIKKKKNALFRGFCIGGIAASLAFGGINNAVQNNRLINSTTYEVAQNNSISPSMYLSTKGEESDLLCSPMFGGSLLKNSYMFSKKNKFDNFLIKSYTDKGNYGIYKYIAEKINSGELYSLSEMKNLTKANKIFSLSVMQDEFMNALGDQKDKSNFKSAKFVKKDNIPDSYDNVYLIFYYDSTCIDYKTLNCDSITSKYIKDYENYDNQINKKMNYIYEKSKENPEYKKSVDYYRNLIEISDLVSKSFEETNTFAIRNHEKHLALFGNKIVTKGVDFNSTKDVDKMKINLHHDDDDHDNR